MDLFPGFLSIEAMDTERTVVYGTVSLVLLTTLASGPLVGAVDLTTEPDRPTFGDGTVTVRSVAIPESGELTKARFGAGRYYLRVPPASVYLERVTGNPRLVYRIQIDALGYSRNTVYALSSENVGRFTLTLGRDRLETSDFDRSSYEGRLSVERWSGGTERHLVTRNITIEVVE